MSNMILHVEFLAGTNITTAAMEAKALARKLDLAYVKFNFNGVEINIGKNANCDVLESKYMRVLQIMDTATSPFVVENGGDR